jgi:hypothetical protein
MMQIYENSQEVTKANEGLAVDPYDATNENAMDPYELDATLRQGAHNNKLRKACVDLETKILEMHAGEYTDPIQYQLSCAHKKAIENLDALEASMKWSLTTTYDVQKLQRDCGLELSLQELCRADASPNYFDLIPLKKEMNALRKKVQKEEIIRPESAASGMGRTMAITCERLEEIETRVKAGQMDATEWCRILHPLPGKVKAWLSIVSPAEALHKTDHAMADKNQGVQQVKELQSKALQDGDMAVAEEASYAIIASVEQLMELVGDKFQVIASKEEEIGLFADMFSTAAESNKKTRALKQAFRSLSSRCETDLARVHDSIIAADAEDVEALKQWAAYSEENTKETRANEAAQTQLWQDMWRNRYTTLLPDIIAELRQKGRARYELTTNRITKSEQEELRKVEYGQFLEVVALHKRTLELTIDNAETSVLCLGLVEQIMHNISVKLRDWFDKCQQEMYSLRIMVHREHLGYFRETYLCIGDLLYKKEKKIEEIDRQLRLEHIQLEFCIETFDLSAKRHSEAKKELMKIREATAEEIEMLKGKVGQAMEDFLESEEALKIEGLDFMHPAEEFQYLVMNQREKINLYKAHFNKEEEVRIVAEREEIRRLVALTPVKNQWGSSPEAIPRPLEFAAE